ncbi:MAG: permease [Planctomycetes bacterium]|nr:permease [Planctomycetota bacterium]
MSPALRLHIHLFARAGWDMVVAFAPYVIAGAIAGGYLEASGFGRGRDLAARLGRLRAIPSIVFAVALGMVSPFCTYGTVPIVAALLRGGLPPATAAAFLSASSLMNPQLFAMTAGGLGWRLAFARVAGAALIATALGIGIALLGERARTLIRIPPEQGSAPDPAAERTARWPGIRAIAARAAAQLEFIAPWLLAGILVAAAIRIFVPPDVVLSVAGRGQPLAVAISSLLGVPFYACGGAAIPVLGTLSGQGVPSGAILAFLLSGPATRITALAALAVLFRARFVAAYAAYVVLLAIAIGEGVRWLAPGIL